MSSTAPRQRATPKSWRYQADAWRWSKNYDDRYVTSSLRLRGGTVLPASLRARILAMGIPFDIMVETLREIRSLKDWTDAWIETAQRFLGDFRRQVSGNLRRDAAQARMMAGFCYHVAQLFPGPDPRTPEHCRATAATLVAQALPDIAPHARKVNIPWRNHDLPAILVPGPDSPEPSALIVSINGASTVKEEVMRWSAPFDQLGIATLFIDSPGTGESRHLGPISPDHDDLLNGVFEMLRSFPVVDPRRVGVLGISIGGNLAIRSLAYDRRIAAAIAVTPPYEPARWIEHASPLHKAELRASLIDGDEGNVEEIAASFSLHDMAPTIQRPTLIVGGGRDLVVPPSESTMLASRLGALSTLDWYPEGGHVLYNELPAWTTDAAQWFHAVQADQSTRVDDRIRAAAIYREALFNAPLKIEWDESQESARLLSPEERDITTSD